MLYPPFVKRDLDGFFGLAIDNLVQLLLIVGLCGATCGMSGENGHYIYRLILPGAAVSILLGNIFYALQAHWVARRERRSDVTALPYGINTPSLLVYVFFVMRPAYEQTGSAHVAWQLGLIACLGSGIIELAGAFFAEKLRRSTPRAALLGTLAGIAITFISMTFALQIWQRPIVAMIPMAVILLTYFARVRFPLGLPGGLVAVVLGTGIAWACAAISSAFPGILPPQYLDVSLSVQAVQDAWAERGRYWPVWSGPALWDALTTHAGSIVPLLSVIIPMGLFNLIGSLQNIESAEAGGDVFATGPSLAVNGIGTIAAALFGSCFPTTIYIGHPGWKALGARAGYSILNGVVITAICFSGTVLMISRIIPLEAGIAIVLWIGIIITAQAFQATPVRHAPAVALGLFPAIAAWGATIVLGTFISAGLPAVGQADVATTSVPAAQVADAAPAIRAHTMQDVLEGRSVRGGVNSEVNGFLIHGLNILERGYIFTCMIVAAVAAFLIDRQFRLAALWTGAAAVLTLLGLMHAYQLSGNVVDYLPLFSTPQEGAFTYRAIPLVVGYGLMAVLFAVMGRGQTERPLETVEDARVVDVESPVH